MGVSTSHGSNASDTTAKSTKPAIKGNAESLVKIVDTALVLKVQHGKLTYSLQPDEDTFFAALSTPQKKVMVQYLQCLRLLIWLLRKENYLMTASCKDPRPSSSPLAREASVHSLAAFSTSYSALDLALGQRSLQLECVLPWLRCKPWLQYLFDRVEDRAEDGERIMSMVMEQWERMPIPDNGDAVYYFPVPQKPPPRRKTTSSGAKISMVKLPKYALYGDGEPYIRILHCCSTISGTSYESTKRQLSIDRHLSQPYLNQQGAVEGTCDLHNHEIGQEHSWLLEKTCNSANLGYAAYWYTWGRLVGNLVRILYEWVLVVAVAVTDLSSDGKDLKTLGNSGGTGMVTATRDSDEPS